MESAHDALRWMRQLSRSAQKSCRPRSNLGRALIGQWLQWPNHGSHLHRGLLQPSVTSPAPPPPTPSSHFRLPSRAFHGHPTRRTLFRICAVSWHLELVRARMALRNLRAGPPGPCHSPAAIGGAPRPACSLWRVPVLHCLQVVPTLQPDPDRPYPALPCAPRFLPLWLASRAGSARKANLCFDFAGRKRRVFQVWKSLNPTAPTLSCRHVRAR
jgi:hypothetical protein